MKVNKSVNLSEAEVKQALADYIIGKGIMIRSDDVKLEFRNGAAIESCLFNSLNVMWSEDAKK